MIFNSRQYFYRCQLLNLKGGSGVSLEFVDFVLEFLVLTRDNRDRLNQARVVRTRLYRTLGE